MVDPEKIFKQMEALAPLLDTLVQNPGLVAKLAQDAAAAAGDAQKLAADVAALSERVAALEAHPAVSVPPLHHVAPHHVAAPAADPNAQAVASNQQE